MQSEPAASITPTNIADEGQVEVSPRGKKEPVPEHLRLLFESSTENLCDQDKEKVAEVLTCFQDVFSKGSHDLGRATSVKYDIVTGDATPVKQPPRRIPVSRREEAFKAIEDMEKQGIVEPSTSPWSCPVVLVRKKDGSTRFCVDYRRLNDVTRKDSFPLPRIDVTLNALNGATWFSTLDLKSGYWQVELEPSAKEKTAFSAGKGLWQFKVMPSGLCNAPATFERLMEAVLFGLSWKTCLIYLDDIIVHAASFNDHIENLCRVLERLRRANLKLNPKKCRLFQQQVQFLGYTVSKHGISADQEKVKVVQSWPQPRSVREVRSFLGLCTYYRRFVPGFANIAKPLHQLSEKNAKFLWTEECNTAFRSLKHHLTKTPTLCYPDFEKPFILDTYASNVAIGAVLSQVADGVERPIAYFSQTLSKPETRYCVTRRELLAVLKATEHFHPYLYGNQFLIRTDHASLRWLLSFKNPEGQMARWLQKLQQYDFNIEHRPGNQHGNADALSRRPCEQSHCCYCEKREVREWKLRDEEPQHTASDIAEHRVCSASSELPESAQSSLQRIGQAQRSDTDVRCVITWMEESSTKPEWGEVSSYSTAVKSFWGQWESLKLHEGKLYRIVDNVPAQQLWQLVVPKALRKTVLEQLHDSPVGGHFGVAKTLAKVRERFFWPKCRQFVEEWCRKCDKCASRKGPTKRRKGPMKQFNVGAPLERVAVDVMGPLPTSTSGNKYILILGDYFTKWVEAYPLENQQAETVAGVIVKEFVSRFGVPFQLHSDQGRNFEAELFQKMCELLGIEKTRTTALHP